MRKNAVTIPIRGSLLRFPVSVAVWGLLATCGPKAWSTVQTPNAPSGAAWTLAQSNPTALVRKASQIELQNSVGNRPPMRYRLRRITEKSDTTKEIVETASGAVARLIAIDGRALTDEQSRQELARLNAIAQNPAIEEHRRNSEKRDAGRAAEVMRLLPDAYLYTYAGQVESAYGPLIRLTFVPNPTFSPPDLMSRALTGIRGEIRIDPREYRVVRVEGQSFKKIDYGWGLLGSLDRGGSLFLQQKKTSCCGWQLAQLKLDLQGRALLIKAIHISVDECAGGYHSVPPGWTYKAAVEWLLHISLPATPAPLLAPRRQTTGPGRGTARCGP